MGLIRLMPKVSLDKIKAGREKSAQIRRKYEADWKLNLAYLAGDQHVEYLPTQRDVVQLPVTSDTARVTRNHLLKINRIERAKILKNQPVPVALPVSDNQDDIITARIATSFFRQMMEEWEFKRRLRTAVSWTLATGNGFFKWWWDPNSKTPRCTVSPPFELYFDPYATNLMDARWAIHSQFMPEETALALYGTNKAKLLTPGKYNQVYSSETSTLYSSSAANEREQLDGVMVHEYWQPPSGADEKGAYVVYTDDGILYESDFPYAHNRLPFTQIGHIERTGSMWYRSGLDALRSLQDELNRSEAQIVENRNLSQGKWWIDDLIDLREEPNGEPRQILRGSGPGGIKPELIQVNTMAGWVGGEPDRIANAMSDLIGQHEVSNAGVPGRVEAASAIQLLQEVDDSVLQDVRESMEAAVATGFMMSIGYVKQFGNPVTQVKVYDKAGTLELMELKKDKLSLDMRVVARTTAGLPMSLAGRQQTMMDLKRYGILEDNNKILELMDFPSEQFDLLSDQDDRNKAHRENKLLAKGRVDQVRAGEWDNHSTHRMQHWKFMKTPEYEALEPEAQQMFQMHVAQHDDLEKILLGKEYEKNAIAQGQMPAPGAAPPTAPGAQPPVDPNSPPMADQAGAMQALGSPPPVPLEGQEVPQPAGQPPAPQMPTA